MTIGTRTSATAGRFFWSPTKPKKKKTDENRNASVEVIDRYDFGLGRSPSNYDNIRRFTIVLASERRRAHFDLVFRDACKTHSRSHGVTFFLPRRQFVSVRHLATPATFALRDGDVRFIDATSQLKA